MNTLAHGGVGRLVIWTVESSPVLLQALKDFNNNASNDPCATLVLIYGYIPDSDNELIVSYLTYGKPMANPLILQNFTCQFSRH
jgi:hypothetical protein